MSSTANQDITLQGYTVDTGIDGFAAALKAYREGTDEVKSLILNEMSLIYECCYCRNMFRSFPNFIAHKRRYCRSKVSALKEEKEAAESSDKGKRQSRDPTTLRQYNFIRKLNERVEETTVTLPLTKNEITIHTLPKISKTVPVTSFRDGYQQVEGTPQSLNLAIKERVPDDRVVFITPVDRSREYGEMNLRRRKHPEGVSTSRWVSKNDIELFERVPEQLKNLVDVANLSCQSPKCKREVAPFASLSVLIYHLCIRHQQPVNSQFVCFLCDPTPKIRNHDLLKEHLKQVHEDVRMEHIQDRKTIDPQKDLSKRFVRNLKAKTVSPSRHRSISPDSVDSEFEESDSPIPDDDMPVLQDESSSPSTDSSPKKMRSQTSPPGRHRKSAYPQRLRSASPRESPTKSSAFASNTGESILSKEDAERIDRMLHKYKRTSHGKDNGAKESSPESNTTSTGNSDFEGDDDDSPPQLERAQRNRKPTNRFKDFVVDPIRTSGGGKTSVAPEQPEHSNAGRVRFSNEPQNKVSMSPPKILRAKRRLTDLPGTEAVSEDAKKLKATEASQGHHSEGNKTDNERPENRGQPTGDSDETSGSQTFPAAESDKQNTSSSVPSESEGTASAAETTTASKNVPSSMVAGNGEEDTSRRMPIDTAAQAKSNGSNGDAPTTSTSSAGRRKQSFSGIGCDGNEDPPKANLPPRPEDLTEVPVYLTEVQRDLFFSPLRPLFTNAKDGLHQCSECGVVLRSLLEGRRHMVSHIRVMRIRCSLCNAGAFFCSDMRIHLMYRHCENLHLAPDGYVTPGTALPCMDKKKADDLSRLADPMNPGRVTFTPGKIVSCTSATPYVPDADIEARILGAHRPKTPKKVAQPQSASRVHLGPSLLAAKDSHPPKLEPQQSLRKDIPNATTITLD